MSSSVMVIDNHMPLCGKRVMVYVGNDKMGIQVGNSESPVESAARHLFSEVAPELIAAAKLIAMHPELEAKLQEVTRFFLLASRDSSAGPHTP